ncbi:hypothetical protein QR680_005757 [Steinernema hermaphroditum]|uniref:Uncharacterized protein n=1 Tax=Steinernema hermaphroditum TaxID=289476 RepID=A0AA39HVH2_9BILA|nr:hypothetical protein QR680_005757 [Steinernema hermaphroditum]
MSSLLQLPTSDLSPFPTVESIFDFECLSFGGFERSLCFARATCAVFIAVFAVFAVIGVAFALFYIFNKDYFLVFVQKEANREEPRRFGEFEEQRLIDGAGDSLVLDKARTAARLRLRVKNSE